MHVNKIEQFSDNREDDSASSEDSLCAGQMEQEDQIFDAKLEYYNKISQVIKNFQNIWKIS